MIYRCKFCPVVLRFNIHDGDWDLFKHIILYHNAMKPYPMSHYWKKEKEDKK